MKRLKIAGHKFLHRLGIDINRYRPPEDIPTAVDMRRAGLLQALAIDVLLDVGANVGQYAQSARRMGYSGRIISFEPVSAVFEGLAKKANADPLWDAIQCGLGPSAGTAQINVAGNNAESSSFLQMAKRTVEEAPRAAYVGSETVRVRALDDLTSELVRPSDKLWLKLDVQGFELAVLEGATRTLDQVLGLELELSLVPLYDGQPLVNEALGRVAAMGFQLIGVEEVFHDAAQLRSLQLNGIFERVTSELNDRSKDVRS